MHGKGPGNNYQVLSFILIAESMKIQAKVLKTLKNTVFENIEGKGENPGYQHFLLFWQMFSVLSITYFIIRDILNPLPHNPDF